MSSAVSTAEAGLDDVPSSLILSVGALDLVENRRADKPVHSIKDACDERLASVVALRNGFNRDLKLREGTVQGGVRVGVEALEELIRRQSEVSV